MNIISPIKKNRSSTKATLCKLRYDSDRNAYCETIPTSINFATRGSLLEINTQTCAAHCFRTHSLTHHSLTIAKEQRLNLVRIVLIHCVGVSCHAQQHCCLTTFASLFRVTFMTIRTNVYKSSTVNNRNPSFLFSLLKHSLTQYS